MNFKQGERKLTNETFLNWYIYIYFTIYEKERIKKWFKLEKC